MEARRIRLAQQAQALPGHRRTSFATPSPSSGNSPPARYLSSPSTHGLELDVDETLMTASPSSDRWSLKRRWSKRLGDVPEQQERDGLATKPNTLKKREPSQPPFLFHDDDDEEGHDARDNDGDDET